MRRPNGRPARAPLSDQERQNLASNACYVGSPEHKDKRWWGGLPKARQLAGGRVGRPGKQTTTVCPMVTERQRDMATNWVRAALRDGNYRFVEADKIYPKHIHHDVHGTRWTGLCVNSVAGEYKGWPES